MINNNAKTSIQERTEDFAIRVIKAYCELNKRHFDEQLPKEAKSCFTHDDGTFVPWQGVVKTVFEKRNVNRS